MKLTRKQFERSVAEVLHEKALIEKHQKAEMIARLMVADYLEQEKTEKVPCGKYMVSKISRFIFKDVPLDIARSLQATKEALDTAKLGRLAKEGVKIKGLNSVDYVTILEQEKK